jgi:hypothetical protein
MKVAPKARRFEREAVTVYQSECAMKKIER